MNVTSGSQVIDDVTDGAGGNDVSTANAEIKVKHVQYVWIRMFRKVMLLLHIYESTCERTAYLVSLRTP